jgi:hypothetical protein
VDPQAWAREAEAACREAAACHEAAAVVDGDKDMVKRSKNMKASHLRIPRSPWRAYALTTFGCLVISANLLIPVVAAQTSTNSTTAKAANTTVASKTFASAQEAANALIAAAEKYDIRALERILGPGGKDVIDTGEPARDREQALAFAAQAREKQNVVVDPQNARRATLSVGKEDWPFPVPIVNVGGLWSFDSPSGIQELRRRRIGRNELDAIQVCQMIVDAQQEYAYMKHGAFGTNQYAQRIISTPGKQDGLAWQDADGKWEGPLGENIARAVERGYTNRNEPFHGYFFKVLKAQGPSAPLGQMNFVVNGLMIGGFALIAAPAEYRVTGVKTFMVSHDGVVYEKDLGPATLDLARKIELFDPDKTWTPVLDQ